MNEIKESKIRIRKKHDRDKFDTLGITQELEKSLSIEEELVKEKRKKEKEKKKKITRFVLVASIIAIVASVIYFLIKQNNVYKSNEYATHYMLSTQDVKVSTDKDNNINFTPTVSKKKIGVIIFPSDRVKNKAYARMAHLISQKGYTVVVPNEKLNMPVFLKGSTEKIAKKHPDIQSWCLVAHSKSGEMALQESANQKKIMGVVFLGTYPTGDDLRLINKKVLTIWGTKDGILDFTKFHKYKNDMPSNANFYEIVGGNNSNFADIELMDNDNKALISPTQQQEITVNEILNFIKSITSV